MSVIDSVTCQPAKVWHELVTFDWRYLLQPSGIGRWPALSRRVLLLFCTLSVSGLVFTVSVMFKPTVSAGDYALLAMLEDMITIEQAEKLFVSTQLLESQRQRSVSYALLQHDPSQKADITKMMDVVSAAAHASGVQLIVVAPQILPGNEPVILRLIARLTLSSLSMFWLELLETGLSFSINNITLELTEKQEIYELNMKLLVPVASDIGRPASQYETQHITEPGDDQGVSELCRTGLCVVQTPHKITDSEGFLLRSGGSKIVYLVRDEKGHLKVVER